MSEIMSAILYVICREIYFLVNNELQKLNNNKLFNFAINKSFSCIEHSFWENNSQYCLKTNVNLHCVECAFLMIDYTPVYHIMDLVFELFQYPSTNKLVKRKLDMIQNNKDDKILESWNEFSRVQKKYKVSYDDIINLLELSYGIYIDVIESKLRSNTWFNTFSDFVKSVNSSNSIKK